MFTTEIISQFKLSSILTMWKILSAAICINCVHLDIDLLDYEQWISIIPQLFILPGRQYAFVIWNVCEMSNNYETDQIKFQSDE